MVWRRLSRDLTTRVHFLFDELLPPILRDQKWVMSVPLRLFFGQKARLFIDFKEQAARMSEMTTVRLYREVQDVVPQRETDLNAGCVEAILAHLSGRTALEVGCGRGYLAQRMGDRYDVTALDIVLDPRLLEQIPQVRFVAGNILRLPFPDGQFDTVVCAHTLEHVLDLCGAVCELRRVARQRLIIVVPRQRPYRYTFDLHLHFFPYPGSLVTALNPGYHSYACRAIGGDLFYFEDRSAQPRVPVDLERVG